MCWCIILPASGWHNSLSISCFVYAVHVVHVTNPTRHLDLWSSWDLWWDDSVLRPSGRVQNCGDGFGWSSHGTACSCDSIYLHKRWYAPGVHSKLNPSFKSAWCFSGNYINRVLCCSSGYMRHHQLMMIIYFHSWEHSARHRVMNTSLHLSCRFICICIY